MAARDYQDELERQRYEQGQQFLKQMGEMFQQTRTDLAQQFVPRMEMEHVNAAIERVANAVEKLTGNVSNFHESAPRIFADKVETKQDIAGLETQIGKLETAFEAFKERTYGYRYEDQGKRYDGDERTERGYRTQAQQMSTQALAWVIGGGFILFTTAVSIILAVTHR